MIYIQIFHLNRFALSGLLNNGSIIISNKLVIISLIDRSEMFKIFLYIEIGIVVFYIIKITSIIYIFQNI